MKYTPEDIQKLEPNQIFVYGSNSAGYHGAGAARLANLKFGAKYGKIGLVGQSYGLCTKDKNIKTLPLEDIRHEIAVFVSVATAHPHLEFLCTAIGTGLAGYTVEEIARLFRDFILPPNIIFPESFHKIIFN